MQSWTDGRPLLLALKDEQSGVRREAAKALAGTGDWVTLGEALHSDDPQVRKGAIQALLYTRLFWYSAAPEKKPPDAGPILFDMASNDPDPSVRLVAEDALEMWRR